jgi:hypothetical protein
MQLAAISGQLADKNSAIPNLLSVLCHLSSGS